MGAARMWSLWGDGRYGCGGLHLSQPQGWGWIEGVAGCTPPEQVLFRSKCLCARLFIIRVALTRYQSPLLAARQRSHTERGEENVHNAKPYQDGILPLFKI